MQNSWFIQSWQSEEEAIFGGIHAVDKKEVNSQEIVSQQHNGTEIMYNIQQLLSKQY